jgi:hypothetical protein
MARRSTSLKNPVLAAFLAWLVPGLGHFYQGRIGKGVLYSTCILGLFFLGFYLGDWRVVYWSWVNPLADPENFRLYYVGQFFAGLPALPALIQATLASWNIEPIFWQFQAMPDANTLNGLHPRLGKLVEVGSVYTTVAGFLNIFAIYDAFDGPAFSDEAAGVDEAQAVAAATAEPASQPLQEVKIEGNT